MFRNEDDINLVYVGVYRHVIFGVVVIHEATEVMVGERLFMERHADAPDDDA